MQAIESGAAVLSLACVGSVILANDVNRGEEHRLGLY